MPIRVHLHWPPVPLDVFPQHTHVLSRSIRRHKASPTPAARIIDHTHQVAHTLPAAFDPIVRRGVPLHQRATATPPLSPTMILSHRDRLSLPQPPANISFAQHFCT